MQNLNHVRNVGMVQQKETIATINDLIETLKDGQEGFRQAAEAVENPKLKSVFNEYSLQRARFAGELQSQAVALGESKPEDSGSAAGAMHRAWINLKSAIAKHTIMPSWQSASEAKIRRSRSTRRRWKRKISPHRCAKLFCVSMPKCKARTTASSYFATRWRLSVHPEQSVAAVYSSRRSGRRRMTVVRYEFRQS